MPFDPTKPANGGPLSATEMRAQFNALKALQDGLTASVASLQQQVTTLSQTVANLLAAGYITQGQLDAAVATCAKNVDNFQPQSLGASDPPTQAELQSLMDNEAQLIAALHR